MCRCELSWWSYVHVCMHLWCVRGVCSALISWGNGLNNEVAFFAIWPCGCSLCSVVSKIHKGTLGLSIFECVWVCVYLPSGKWLLWFSFFEQFDLEQRCMLYELHRYSQFVLNPSFSILSIALFLFITLLPYGPEEFLYSCWNLHPMIWIISNPLAVQKLCRNKYY